MLKVNLRPFGEIFRVHMLKMLKKEGLTVDSFIKKQSYATIGAFSDEMDLRLLTMTGIYLNVT